MLSVFLSFVFQFLPSRTWTNQWHVIYSWTLLLNELTQRITRGVKLLHLPQLIKRLDYRLLWEIMQIEEQKRHPSQLSASRYRVYFLYYLAGESGSSVLCPRCMQLYETHVFDDINRSKWIPSLLIYIFKFYCNRPLSHGKICCILILWEGKK